MTRLVQTMLNRRSLKSRALAEQGRYRRALGPNQRAIGLMELIARQLPDGDIANRSTLGDLYYERSDFLQQLDRGPQAIEAVTRALSIYATIDPTYGDPDAVPRVIAAHRAEFGEQSLEAFEMHIGRPANARSYLALLLAVHRRREARAQVESLSDNAVRTFTALVKFGVAYEKADLDRVRGQVARARAQLLR
jgi:tetratricopeptide (TPR) repeat protein